MSEDAEREEIRDETHQLQDEEQEESDEAKEEEEEEKTIITELNNKLHILYSLQDMRHID
jgi:hypothetical protein